LRGLFRNLEMTSSFWKGHFLSSVWSIGWNFYLGSSFYVKIMTASVPFTSEVSILLNARTNWVCLGVVWVSQWVRGIGGPLVVLSYLWLISFFLFLSGILLLAVMSTRGSSLLVKCLLVLWIVVVYFAFFSYFKYCWFLVGCNSRTSSWFTEYSYTFSLL
jgi:hypothetical protein